METSEKKTVLITGSSRGIGKATATKYAENGYNVVINCALSQNELLQTEKELKELNKNILAIKCDISDYSETEKMFTEIKKHFGAIDILVNNAGISYIGLFNLMSPHEWQKIMNVNVNGVYNCCHLSLSDMINKKNGCIINISSMWGNTGASCEAVYSASKGAVNSFTKALAKELGPSGINVNAISCGVIDTKMNEFLSTEERTSLIDEIPLMRFGKPEEVASLVYFLSSKEAKYLTGQIITLDGGMI